VRLDREAARPSIISKVHHSAELNSLQDTLKPPLQVRLCPCLQPLHPCPPLATPTAHPLPPLCPQSTVSKRIVPVSDLSDRCQSTTQQSPAAAMFSQMTHKTCSLQHLQSSHPPAPCPARPHLSTTLCHILLSELEAAMDVRGFTASHSANHLTRLSLQRTHAPLCPTNIAPTPHHIGCCCWVWLTMS
jgi:hypothetical protein